MKVGIITFWQSNDNYGQLLQCWALQQQLMKMGHEPFLIRYDFINNKPRSPIWKRVLKSVLIYPLYRKFKRTRKLREIQQAFNAKNRQRQFDLFREQKLSLSEKIYKSLSDLQCNPPIADCYIVGSDQVWAQLISFKDNQVFYLDFGDSAIRRIAYAPSFSMTEYPAHLLPLLKKQLQRFDAISVREEVGVDICKSVGFSAVRVLDPTLLLEKCDYTTLIPKNLTTASYIYVYSLNISTPDDLYWNDLNLMSQQYNLKLIVTTGSGYIPGYEIFNDVTYSYATIQQWLSYINDANLVVTSSFHGIVFSIILETPFVYIPLKGNFSSGNNRILDLLYDLGLESRILTNERSYFDIYHQVIDWTSVKNRLKGLQEQSIQYLKQSLL